MWVGNGIPGNRKLLVIANWDARRVPWSRYDFESGNCGAGFLGPTATDGGGSSFGPADTKAWLNGSGGFLGHSNPNDDIDLLGSGTGEGIALTGGE